MKRLFILMGSIINVLAITAFLYVGRGMLEPHRFEDGIALAIPAILTIVVGWTVSAILWAKRSNWAIDAVGITYVIAFIVVSLCAGSIMGDNRFVLSMAIWALPILGVAYAAMWLTLLFIFKFEKNKY